MLSGNHVSAFVDPESIFRAVTSAIRRAERQILFDIFLLGGQAGEEIADYLTERVQAGVEIKILYDPHLGGPMLRPHHEPVLRRLRAAGAAVLAFAVDKLPGWRPLKADHNKVLIVDGGEAFVGGFNFHDGSRRNHDLMLRLRGPAAGYLAELFAYNWTLSGGAAPARAGTPCDEGPSLVRVTVTNPDRRDIRGPLLTALAEAQEAIAVSMYVLGDAQVEAGLIAAQQRGVAVRVILDPNIQAFSLPINGMPNVAALLSLGAARIPLRLYPVKPGGQMHLKLAVFDHRLVVTGSANWTTLGLDGNNETTLFIDDRRLAAELEAVFERDWELASPPPPLRWRDRLLGWLILRLHQYY